MTFTSASELTYAEIAQVLYRCNGNFEERMAGLARAQREPWQERADHMATADGVAELADVHDTDPSRSVIGYDLGAVVAIALLGRRGSHGWLGDFAVAPSHRGRGLGHALLRRFLDSARESGIRDVSFDVLAVNTPAIRTYERAGFRVACEQHELLASSEELGLAEWIPGEVSPADAARLADWYERMIDGGEPEPCWERRLPSLLAANVEAISYRAGGRERAILAHTPEEAEGGRKVALMFGGFSAAAGDSELEALLRAAGGRGETSFRAGLEPSDSRFAGLLRHVGFRLGRRSLEMRLTLEDGWSPGR